MNPLLPLLLALLPVSAALASSLDGRALRGGWYPWDPYQYETDRGGVTVIGGLDVRLVRAILEDAGARTSLDEVGWEAHLEDIRTGRRDLAAGASWTAERETYAWFSQPYRRETNVLILPRRRSSAWPAANPAELFQRMGERGLRLGVVRGYHYGPDYEAFAASPGAARIVPALQDRDNLARLLAGEIDAFLCDRLVAATLAWRAGALGLIEEHPVPVFETPIHVLLSKATCTEADADAFNASLQRLRDSGGYHQITRSYVIPVLLGITVHQAWFMALGLIGTVAFALSGVLLARKEGYDLFGAFVLATLPALGGGVLRDVLTDRYPISILRGPALTMQVVIATVLAGALFYRLYDLWAARRPASSLSRLEAFSRPLITLFDSVGLAAFTITGVVIAVEQQCEPLWLWGPLLAALTGAGGGILRDVVRARGDNPSLQGDLYPEVALLWGFVFSLFLEWQTERLSLEETGWAVILTVLGALATRLAALRWGWRSLFLARQ